MGLTIQQIKTAILVMESYDQSEVVDFLNFDLDIMESNCHGITPNSELKPCPFCGSERVAEDYEGAIYTSDGLTQTGYVECYECLANGSWITHTDKEHGGQDGLSQAVRDNWNNRKG